MLVRIRTIEEALAWGDSWVRALWDSDKESRDEINRLNERIFRLEGEIIRLRRQLDEKAESAVEAA